MSSERDGLRASLDNTSIKLQEVLERLDGIETGRSADRRLLAGVVASLVAVAGLGFVGWWDDRNDDRAEDRRELAAAQAACEFANESRADIRSMVKDGSIASGVAGGEALLAAVAELGREVDPATADVLRGQLTDHLTPALTDIVARLPGRAWLDGRCVDVAVENLE